MHFETDRMNSTRTHRVVLTMFAIMILPTASWVTGENLRAADESEKASTEKTDATKDASEKSATAAANPDEKKEEPREETPYPQLIEATPAPGATDVDPKLTEIRVTFDRDMSESMSWTGGGPEFPGDASQKAKWIDKRTCVLPVKLKKESRGKEREEGRIIRTIKVNHVWLERIQRRRKGEGEGGEIPRLTICTLLPHYYHNYYLQLVLLPVLHLLGGPIAVMQYTNQYQSYREQ